MNPKVYADEMNVAQALQIYFAQYHFADGGYTAAYFKIKLGPLLIPVPNTSARIHAVKFHDIHHVLTEYTAFWKGEIQIGAWEIASGCGSYYVAWLLNLGSFSIGLFLHPKALFDAFMSGRHVASNLYHGYDYDALLEKNIGALREELQIDIHSHNTLSDYMYFCMWALMSFILWLLFGMAIISSFKIWIM